MAVIQGVTQQDALDILDFHIFTNIIGEGHVAGEIRAAALQVGGIVTGLEDDFLHDGVEGICQAITGGIEIFVHIGLAGYIGILGNSNILAAVIVGAAGTLDIHSQLAIAQGQIGTPQRVGQGGAVGIHNRLGNVVAADVEAQGVEQATHIRIVLLIMGLDLRHHISSRQLGQKGVACGQVAFVAVAHIGSTHIGVVGCTGGASAVGHKYQDGHAVITGLPVIVTDDGVHFLEHLHGLKKARLDVGTAAKGLCVIQVGIGDCAPDITIHRNSSLTAQAQIFAVAAGSIAVDGQNTGHTLGVGGGAGGAGRRIQRHAHTVIFVGVQQGLNGTVGRIDQILLGIGVAHRAGQVQHQNSIGGNGGVAHDLLVGCQCGQGGQEILIAVQHRNLAAEGLGILKYGLIGPNAAGVDRGQVVHIKILGPVVHGIGVHDPVVERLSGIRCRSHRRNVANHHSQGKQYTEDSLSHCKFFHIVFLRSKQIISCNIIASTLR